MSKRRHSHKDLKEIDVSSVNAIYDFIDRFGHGIENPELLTDVAESVWLAIETRDPKLLDMARKQNTLFFLQDGGAAIEDELMTITCRRDEQIDLLFDEELGSQFESQLESQLVSQFKCNKGDNMKAIIEIFKGVRIVMAVIICMPLSIFGLLGGLGSKKGLIYSDMPKWFISTFEFVAGTEVKK